jgi:hypothetical protein
MSEMVERVARALAYDVRPPTTEFEDMPVDEYWRRLAAEGGDAEFFMGQARAAIEAMREPTDLMGLGLPQGYKPGSHSATQIWQTMIDAALSEGR